MKSVSDRLAERGNASLLLSLGTLLSMLVVGTFSIDIPAYMCVRQQLQTATDAAALAGAVQLPVSQEDAEAAAYDMAARNIVAGETLQPDALSYSYDASSMKVTGTYELPTITARILCGLAGSFDDDDEQQSPGNEADFQQNCTSMTVTTASKAVPAPRDTVLVIDTSNSMDDLGNNQPFVDVKEASKAFVDMLISMNSESVDRVAVVKFDKTSTLKIGFSSEAPDYNAVKSQIDGLTLYSGSGWNTNYEAGLKVALDEIQAHARPNSHKTIVFFTDGEPNLPGPGSPTISSCITKKNQGQHAAAQTCAQTYTNHMIAQTTAQVTRAEGMDVRIHTIQIGDADPGNSLATFQSLLMDNDWEAGLLDTMASTTEGDQFEAENNDGPGIMTIFQEIAKLVTVKLSG